LFIAIAAHDPGRSDLRVVVEDPRGNAAEVREGPDMAFEGGLSDLRRKCRHEAFLSAQSMADPPKSAMSAILGESVWTSPVLPD
jgi:hypothetical protein